MNIANNAEIIKIGFDYASELTEMENRINATLQKFNKKKFGLKVSLDIDTHEIDKKLSQIQSQGKNQISNRTLINKISSLDRTVIGLTEGKDSEHRSRAYLGYVEALKTKMQSLRNISGFPITIIPANEKDKIRENVAEVEKLIRKMNRLKQTAQGRNSSPAARDRLLSEITNWERLNTLAARQNGAELSGMKAALRGAGGNADIEKLTAQFARLKAQVAETGKAGMHFFDAWKAKLRSLATSLTTFMSFYQLIALSRRIVSAVVDVNTQFTELSKVSNIDLTRLEQSMGRFAELAKDVGGSLSDTVSATADWSRNGYNLVDSEELARVALIYKNVGDGINIDSANASLISTLRGFKLEAKDAMEIVDKFNEVANNFPISSAGIGEALKRSASSFYTANTSLSEGIALIAAANSVVQNPEVVGTMYKTLSMRIRSTKSEVEALGEDTDGMVESTAKLRDIVKGMTGFDIMKDDDTFKSVYEIILGIGKEWNKLSDIDQAGLLEKLAGKRHGNALSAVLNNIDMLEEAYKTAEGSAGSALREQERYEKSVRYSLDRLRASSQEFANTFLSSKTLKGIVDGLFAITEGARQLIGIFGALHPVAVAMTVAFVAFNKNMGFAMLTLNNGKLGNNMLNYFRATNIELKNMKSLLSGITQYYGAAFATPTNAVTQIQGYNAARADSKQARLAYVAGTENKQLKGYFSQLKKSDVASLAGFQAYLTSTNQALKATSVVSAVAAGSLRIFGTVLNTLVPVLVISGLFALGKAFLDFAHRAENAVKKTEELATGIQKTKDELKSLGDELKTTGQRIAELNAKGNLTLVEQEELSNLKQKNKQLERELFLKTQLAKVETKEAAKQAEKTFKTNGYKGSATMDVYANKIFGNLEAIDRGATTVSTVVGLGKGALVKQIKLDKTEELKKLAEVMQDIEAVNSTAAAGSETKIATEALLKRYEEYINESNDNSLKEFNNVFNQGRYDKARGEIRGLLAQGELSADTLTSKFPALVKELDGVGISAEEATEHLLAMSKVSFADNHQELSLAQNVDNINELASGFEQLSKLYKDVGDGGGFDFSQLSSDKMKVFSQYTEEYNAFLLAVTTSPNNITGVQAAFNNLTTAWIKGSGALNNLSEANKESAINMLRSYGVANAEEVVVSKLAENKVRLALETIKLTGNIDKQVDAMRGELLAYGLSNETITKLTSAYVLAQQSMTAAIQAGVTSRMEITQAELQNVTNVASAYSLLAGKYQKTKKTTGDDDVETERNLARNMALGNELGKQAEAVINLGKAKEEIEKILAENKKLMGSLKFNGTDKDRGKSSSSSSKDAWLEAFKKELEALKHLYEMDQINTETYYSRLAALNNKYFKGRLKYLSEYRKYEEEIYKGGAKIHQEREQLSNRYIENRNTYNDWGADNEIAARKRVMEWHKDFYAKGIISYKLYIDKMNEYAKNLHAAEIVQYQKEKTALDELYNTAKNLVLQENKTAIDNLNKEIEEYKKLVDLRKRELQLIRDKQNHTRTLAEKQKAVSKIENELSSIKNDDSASAKARRLKLYEDLENAKLNLDDYVAEHEYNTQIKALDDAQRAYEESMNKKKKKLEEFSQDASRVVKATLDRLNGEHSKLLQDLIAWNSKYGTGIEKDITDNWAKATTALEKYKSILGTSDFGTIHNHVKDGAANELRNKNTQSSGNYQRMPSVYKVSRNGSRPSSAQEGDYVVTGGGVVQIVNGKGKKDGYLSSLYSATRNYADLDKALEKVRAVVSARGYATGGINTSTGLAMLHGTNRNTEVIFNSKDAKKLWDIVHTSGSGIDLMQKIFKPNISGSKLPKASLNQNFNSETNINVPITVQGNLDKSVLPNLETMLRNTLQSMDGSMGRSGLDRLKTVPV